MSPQVQPFTARAVPIALGLYLVWTAATWVLEGRIDTLLRPEATGARLVYALANLGLGIVVAVWIVSRLRSLGLALEDAGFGSRRRTIVAVATGLGLGLAFFVLQGAPSRDPVVIVNAFAQVLVVSAAEVLVCWSVVGATVVTAMRRRGRLVATLAGALAAAVLFGLYHFAHSAPFNTWPMVGFLTVVGLATGAFFFVARDAYGTIAFHNFLGTFGVAEALAAAGRVDTLATPQVPLLASAVIALVALVIADRAFLRRRHG